MPRQPQLQLARALIGITYPATKAVLLAHVIERGGQPYVLAILRRLPDRTFLDRSDLSAELRNAK